MRSAASSFANHRWNELCTALSHPTHSQSTAIALILYRLIGKRRGDGHGWGVVWQRLSNNGREGNVARDGSPKGSKQLISGLSLSLFVDIIGRVKVSGSKQCRKKVMVALWCSFSSASIVLSCLRCPRSMFVVGGSRRLCPSQTSFTVVFWCEARRFSAFRSFLFFTPLRAGHAWPKTFNWN